MQTIRWSDNDRYFGPLTYAREGRYRRFGVMLGSGHQENEGCRLRLHAFGHTLIIKLPAIIKPYRVKVPYSLPDIVAKCEAAGREAFYWDEHEREYGFTAAEGAVHFHYGEQTHAWPGSKSKVWFYPWRHHQSIRHTIYDLDGELFADLPDWGLRNRNGWAAKNALEAACPVAKFEFLDFDDERITATCRIEEREWRRGKGVFRVLFFGRNRVERSLDLSFSSEVGRRKGSWKGGTVGHSIKMMPGELHEAAFRRYCAQEGLRFVEGAPAARAT